MLETHCTNTACPEQALAKEVLPELAGADITCGGCGQPTTTPAETTQAAGDVVR